MHHRRADELQCMYAQRQGIAFLDDLPSVGIIGAEELLHNIEGRRGRDDDRIRKSLQKSADIGGMIRFHMLYNEIIRCAGTKDLPYILHPFLVKRSVHCVHNGNLFVHDDIGIVCHAVFYFVLTLEKVYFVVVYTCVSNILCDFH